MVHCQGQRTHIRNDFPGRVYLNYLIVSEKADREFGLLGR
jgi:hypothetical protein